MDTCRVCLSGGAIGDVIKLKTSENEGNKGFSEILQFCLDIQVTEGSSVTRKLCTLCIKKTLSFYQFKCMALKNDYYLRSAAAELTNDGVNLEPVTVREELLDTKCEPDNIHYLQDDVMDENSLFVAELNFNKNNVKTELAIEPDTVSLQGNEPNEGSDSESSIPEEKDNVEEDPDYSESESIQSHTRRRIRKKQKGKQSQNLVGYPCKFCNRIFNSMSVRRRHVIFTHEGANGHCDICNKDVKHLKSHILLMHDRNKLRFECELCGKRFVNKYRQDYHACHKKPQNFCCSECNKKFWCPRELDRHTRAIHEGEKSFLCHFCSKSFFRKSHLIIHLRSHTKEKPYKCEQCEKRFSTGTGLKTHRYTHSNSHQYSCDQCAKSFAGPKYLYNHMQTHRKERKYPCKYCGVSFMRSDTCKTHERNVHEKTIASHV